MASKEKIRFLQGAYNDLMVGPLGAESDKKSSEWILEYVIRYCNNDGIISGLLTVLPFSNENLKLKKMILLKKISSDVSKGSISEKTVETLQSLKDLNRHIYRNFNNEKIMQELCCKAAVECTVKHLRGSCNIDWSGYNEALRRLWSYRIDDTEDAEMDGGVTDIKKELLDVASNPRLRDKVLENHRQEDVLMCLNAFINDSWEEMGPTFLETVAEDVAQGRYNPLTGQGSIPIIDSARMEVPSCEIGSHCKAPEIHEEITSTFPPPWADFHPSAGPGMSKERKGMASNSKENQEMLSKMRVLGSSNGQHLSDRKFPDCQSSVINIEENEISRKDFSIRKEATATQEGGKESGPDLDDVNAHERSRSGTDHISNNKQSLIPEGGKESVPDLDDVNAHGGPRSGTNQIFNNKQVLTPEYIQVKENLRRSTLELHLRVEDPLLNALRVAEDCVARKEGIPTAVHLNGNEQLKNPINEVEKSVLPENTTGMVNQVQHMEERGSKQQREKSHSEPVKFNIMDRNPTAHTFQWDEEDSIVSPEDNSPSASRKVRLPTPVRRHLSPLKRARTGSDIGYRRKPTKWSVLEEETLRKEVAKYGKGRWKYILENNREIFEERTE
ncbi:hypothetical protein KI387_003907, partial [Taxus chinensis]